MTTTSLLIVGLGRGAAWARDIAKSTDLRLAGLVDLDADKLARVGDELGVPAAQRYTDLEPALRAEADIVVLAVPAPLHAEMSLAALRAGHHVICEKPLATSLAEARELRSAVAAGDRRFMVGEQYRFADGVENLRRAVAAGLIGSPAYIAHEFFRAQPPRPPNPGGAPPDPDRAIPEMSIHHFDMWWYITSRRPVEIRADGFSPEWHATGRRFGFSMRATLEDGTHVHYLNCRALARPQTTWYGNLWVVGEEGALFWDGHGGAVTLARTLPTHDVREQHLASGPVSFVSRETGTSATIVMVRELVVAMREGRPHPCDIQDNWPSFATAMAALEAVRTGQPVRVEAT